MLLHKNLHLQLRSAIFGQVANVSINKRQTRESSGNPLLEELRGNRLDSRGSWVTRILVPDPKEPRGISLVVNLVACSGPQQKEVQGKAGELVLVGLTNSIRGQAPCLRGRGAVTQEAHQAGQAQTRVLSLPS